MAQGAERGTHGDSSCSLVRPVSRHGEPGEDRRGVAEGGALGRREAGEPAGQPGVAALAVGQHGGAAGVGERDDDLAAVGLVGAADDVAVAPPGS